MLFSVTIFLMFVNKLSISKLMESYGIKKEGFWKIFPPAGVSEKDIMGAIRFGKAISHALECKEIERRQPVLKGLGAVAVDPNNIRFERSGHRHLLLWGRLLKVIGKQGQIRRLPFLILFIVFLGCMVLISFPFAVFFNVLVNPFKKESIAKEVAYYEGPSKSSTENLESGEIELAESKMR